MTLNNLIELLKATKSEHPDLADEEIVLYHSAPTTSFYSPVMGVTVPGNFKDKEEYFIPIEDFEEYAADHGIDEPEVNALCLM